MKSQAWKCEACGASGAVPVRAGEGAYQVIEDVRRAHLSRTSTCNDSSRVRLLTRKRKAPR